MCIDFRKCNVCQVEKKKINIFKSYESLLCILLHIASTVSWTLKKIEINSTVIK